ncbi:MAG: hypothetical protein Q8M58_13735 [Anaerolineales bacterium]|nr:hypothetical protein [Anaerolineales bacterium]
MRIRFASILLPAPRTAWGRLALVQVLILLAACAMPGQPAPTPAEPTAPPPTPSPTSEATAVSPLAILVIPADMPQDQSNLYQSIVYDLAQQAGMRFQVRNALTVSDVSTEPGLKVVIALPPDSGLAGLAAAAPQVQFLGVGIPGLTSAANLSLIGASGKPVAEQAFLAGYIAAMLSPDYRVGIITQDSPEGLLAEKAFTNGFHFFCGLCQQAFPPIYNYPVHLEIKTDVPEGQYQAYADVLVRYQVEVAFVYPEIATPDLLDYLSQKNIKIISESLPFEDLFPAWIVGIQPKGIPAIQKIFPDLVAGKGGQNISIPLFLTDINPDLLSEGKQRLVEEILRDLQAGYIDPGVKP